MNVLTSIQTLTQRLAARLYTRGRSSADKQRGASALEYIMLAAVIVGLLVALAAAYEDDNPIVEFFDDLFIEAEVGGGDGG